MKKIWIVLCSLLAVVALSGCGPSEKDYLSQSLKIWNGSLTKISPWLGGKKVETIITKLQDGGDLSAEKTDLATFRGEVEKTLSDIQALSVPKGAAEAVQENIVSYYNKVLALTGTLDKLVSLPEGFSDEEGNVLIEEFNTQIEALNKNMMATVAAQQALAKSAGVDFRTYQQF